jgi:hypothetical protein
MVLFALLDSFFHRREHCLELTRSFGRHPQRAQTPKLRFPDGQHNPRCPLVELVLGCHPAGRSVHFRETVERGTDHAIPVIADRGAPFQELCLAQPRRSFCRSFPAAVAAAS